jgi:hypothetical protein
MSSNAGIKADWVIAPYKAGNDATVSNVLRFTLDLAARGDLMPNDWCGGYITMKAIGADCYFYFSNQNTTLPDSAQAAANNGGADNNLGWLLRDGEVMDVIVPQIVRGSTDPLNVVYFCRDGSANGASVWMRKSSE